NPEATPPIIHGSLLGLSSSSRVRRGRSSSSLRRGCRTDVVDTVTARSLRMAVSGLRVALGASAASLPASTRNTCWHVLHRTFRPATVSASWYVERQLGQVTFRDMIGCPGR